MHRTKSWMAPGELTHLTRAEIIWGNLFLFGDTCSLKDGRLELKIMGPFNVEPAKLKVSTKAFFSPNLPPRRSVIPAKNFTSTKLQEKTSHVCSVESSDAQLILALVSYDGEFCHKWWFRDQSKSFNQRYEVHMLLDSDKKFEKTFFDFKNYFEHRITLLFCFMNLTILPYGRIPELQDAPDILAYSGSNDLFVVECTTGDID